PIGGFGGGLLVRPLVGLTSDNGDFREIFALLTVFAGTGVIFAAVYLLIAVQRVFFGPIRHAENEGLEDLSFREQTVLWPLAIVAILMGLFPQPFIDMVNPTVDAYARQFRERANLPAIAMTDAPALQPLTPAQRDQANERRRLPAPRAHGNDPNLRVRKGAQE
ncbi:MAG TPA: hypothetical protein VLC93_20600, partial [Myxococcota bacterium]|nr:hypothetical protein [Myxococcota bacterium]